MKTAGIFPIYLVLLGIILVAGCTGPGISQGLPGMTGNQGTTVTATPASQVTDLSDLALTPGEVPFPVVGEQSGTKGPGSMGTGTFSGALRVFSQAYSSEAQDSPTATILVQSIAEYPPDTTRAVFNELEREFREQNDPKNPVTWLQEPTVGDQSFTLSTVQLSSTNPNPFTMVVFRKANIIEIIMVKTSNADVGSLVNLASAAAAKIPPTGTNIPAGVVPGTIAPSQPVNTPVPRVSAAYAASGLAFAGPLTVTPVSQNSLGKIRFDLQVSTGGSPVDLAGTQFTVSTPGALWQSRQGGPGVRLTVVPAQGTGNTLLEPGEVVTVDLDTGYLDVTPKSRETGRRITIEVRPPVGAGLTKSCTLPSSLDPLEEITCT